jgi:predicted CoA-substrate-specific enzyme activase
LLAHAVAKSGTDFSAKAEALLNQALKDAGLSRSRIVRTVATGYGRRNVAFATDQKTEIGCHARGCYFHFRTAITIIDIGGQDNKIIRLDDDGRRLGFKMNRKCAAGTGAFLEEMAARLDLDLGDMDALARGTDEVVELGSYCTVFTATEILEKIRAGRPIGGIVKGIYHSIARRVLEMDAITSQPVLSGGVAAHNPILIDIFSAMLGRPVQAPPRPQLMGAYGAALFAINEEHSGPPKGGDQDL